MERDEYTRMFEAEERHWWYAGMRAISLALLEGALPAPGRLRILDAGCGTGNNLAHFARWGPSVGIDLSEDALRFCRERGVAAARGSLSELPFAPETFDCVTSLDVLYHRWVTADRASNRSDIVVSSIRTSGWNRNESVGCVSCVAGSVKPNCRASVSDPPPVP